MKKKLVVVLMSVTCCAMLWACGWGKKNNNENADPLTGQEQTTENQTGDGATGANQTGTGDEFESLLAQPNNANSVIDYINTNIGGALETDVDRFFRGLLGYGDNIRDIDFTRLEESRQYMPEDMIAFMELMKLESESPSMVMSNDENRMTIGLTLSEMLERALLFEQHIEKYPDHASTEAASGLYEEIATHAITGGYDRTAGTAHYYQGETSDVVDREALPYYQQFAEANPNSRLGQIVQEYVTLLQENNFQINDNIENFYHSLYQRLQLVSDQNQTGTAGENNSTANGTTGTTGNGATNGTTGGVTNGTTNGTANGTTGGVTNGTTNGVTNGATNGVTNGTTNGVTNGTTNGTGNGTTNGTTTGRTVGNNR